MIGWVVAIIVAFLAGGALVWILNKLRRNKAADDAQDAVKESEDSDADREDVLHDIDEVIKKNEEIRNKIKEKLGKK